MHNPDMRRLLILLALLLTAPLLAQQNRIDIVTPSAPELASFGPLDIGVRTLAVTDRNRPDILNTKPGEPTARYDRTLTLEAWYPAALAAGQKPGGEYRAITRDGTTMATLHGKAVRDAAVLKGTYPLVIVSQMPRGGTIFSDGMEEDFIAFDAGYYLTFLALFHLIIAGSMGLGSTVHTVKRIVDGQLDFLPPALIVLIAIGGALLKLTGVEFEWLQGIVGPLRTSVGNIMFSVATIYLVVSRPSGLDISPTIGDALALILPRLLAGACLLLMTRQLGLQGIAALSAMQFQLLVLIGVFCILPSSSIVYSLIDRSHADAALKDIVRVQVLKSNLIYLALLLVVMCALALVYAFVPPPAPHG